MLRGSKLFLICHCQTHNGSGRTLRLAFFAAIPSALTKRVKHTKELEITDDRHCSSAVTTTTARKSLVNCNLSNVMSTISSWIMITVCRPFNTQRALDKSKQVVERDYAVVGILEDMNTTLTVFEKYIPRFFAGAREIYYNEIKHFNKINKNNFKPPVTEEVKNIVRQNFTREIEFFKFCKERLQRQYIAANLLDFK